MYYNPCIPLTPNHSPWSQTQIFNTPWKLAPPKLTKHSDIVEENQMGLTAHDLESTHLPIKPNTTLMSANASNIGSLKFWRTSIYTFFHVNSFSTHSMLLNIRTKPWIRILIVRSPNMISFKIFGNMTQLILFVFHITWCYM